MKIDPRIPRVRASRACLLAALGAALTGIVYAIAASASSAASPPSAASADPASGPTATVRTTPARRATIGDVVQAYGALGNADAMVQTLNVPYLARVQTWLVTPGAAVRHGATLAKLLPDPSALLTLRQAQGALTLAQQDLAHMLSLYDQRLATQAQLDAARNALANAQAQLAAQRALGLTPGGTTLRAPFDGVVIQLTAQSGDQIQPGAPLLQLARSDAPGNVALGVDPADAAALRIHDPLTLRGLSSALADAPITGTVTSVGAAIDPRTRLVDVTASVPSALTPYLPGTAVVAEIVLHSGVHWVVPRGAVLSDTHGSYLFQVADNVTAHRVDVHVRVENGALYGVDGPLDASRPVVTLGNAELADGMRVHVLASDGP
jgi:RND family efflux transporter MFP subunit